MENLYKKVAIEAAITSGRFIKRSVGRTIRISYKGKDNIVTDIDKKAESIIINKILSAFPDHAVLSEESRPIRSLSPYKWIVDPLDGTTNFAHSFPFFCVSIALEMSGNVVLGVVYDPVRDELFYAEHGKGACLNNKRILVSKTQKLREGFLATGFAYGREKKDRNVANFRRFLMKALAIRRAGSAALDLCYVACGRFDGYWEYGLHPWDSAAGMIIVREAKGLVTRFGGEDYYPYDNDILASNAVIHRSMQAILINHRE
ncbi:MAG: inositol monophosphatase family protein [Candidatus Omnitrophota bacterium]